MVMWLVLIHTEGVTLGFPLLKIHVCYLCTCIYVLPGVFFTIILNYCLISSVCKHVSENVMYTILVICVNRTERSEYMPLLIRSRPEHDCVWLISTLLPSPKCLNEARLLLIFNIGDIQRDWNVL